MKTPIEIEFEVTRISEADQKEMANRKFDIGRVPVCGVCGMNLLQASPGYMCCGQNKRMNLREYIKEILGKPFDAEAWKLVEGETAYLSKEAEEYFGKGIKAELGGKDTHNHV